jgi:hypothetical protein
MNDPFSLLRNDGGNKNNWIKIKLLGTKCNRTAIGARVRIVTGSHAQIDEVHAGTSVMSQSDLRLHFGVGQATKIDSIEVRWPTLVLDKEKTGKNGKPAEIPQIEKFSDVEVNQILTIKEGSGIIKKDKPKAQ